MFRVKSGSSTLPVSQNEKHWIPLREASVQQALDDNNLEALRRISILPGGFGSDAMRRKVWPVLLNTSRYFSNSDSGPSKPSTNEWSQFDATNIKGDTDSSEKAVDAIPSEHTPVSAETPFRHQDESQVLLDTKRSFVSYPKGLPPERKMAMQADLQHLIVGILRRYPALSYFQGYHDIMSVLYLSFIPPPDPLRSRQVSRDKSRPSQASEAVREKIFPGEDRLNTTEPVSDRNTPEWITLFQCAEIASLCRIRDGMGESLEPLMGLLRLLKRLLRVADPQLSRFSESISPVPTLPFFALSWILCLFSHDIDTLEPVQRMFDYLLARNPISAIYLAVAILLAKKPQMMLLAKDLGAEGQDDPSLLHPLFSRLPPLFPDTPDQRNSPAHKSAKDFGNGEEPNPYDPIPLSKLFEIADLLMVKYPWDGPEIRGREIMGSGSVACTYEQEISGDGWSLGDTLEMIDNNVVLPGAGDVAEDEEEILPPIKRRARWRIRLPKNRAGTALALGVLVAGVGIALGSRPGSSLWFRWWVVVAKGWFFRNVNSGQLEDMVEGLARNAGSVAKRIKGLL